MLTGAEDSLGGGFEIGFLRLEDIWDVTLGIPVDYGEPGALDLHHDAVSFQKNVVVAGKGDLIVLDGVGGHRLGFLKAVPVAATQDVAGDH